MRRDYAKKKHKSRSNRQSYWRLWLSTVILFALFTLGLVFLGKHYQLDPMVKNTSTKNLTKESPPKPASTAKSQKQPHFDFYTMPQKNNEK